MTDIELLKCAAKAADLPYDNWCEKISDHDSPHYGMLALYVDNGCGQYNSWNPLEHDGDAFRLAVLLGMEVYVDTHPLGCDCTEAFSVTYDERKKHRAIVSHEDCNDIFKATRKAIVLAAAGLGRAK